MLTLNKFWNAIVAYKIIYIINFFNREVFLIITSYILFFPLIILYDNKRGKLCGVILFLTEEFEGIIDFLNLSSNSIRLLLNQAPGEK